MKSYSEDTSSDVIISAHDTELLNDSFYDVTESGSGEAVLVRTYYDYKDLSTEDVVNDEYRLDYRQIDEVRLDLYIYSKHIAEEANYVVIAFRNSMIRLPRKLLTKLTHFVVEMEEEVENDKLVYTIKLINPRHHETNTMIPLQESPIEVIMSQDENQEPLNIETHYLTTKKTKLKEKTVETNMISCQSECLIRLPAFGHFGIIIEKDKQQNTRYNRLHYRIAQSPCLILKDTVKEVVSLDCTDSKTPVKLRHIGLIIVAIFGIFLFMRKRIE